MNPPIAASDIAANLSLVRGRIAKAAAAANRDPETVNVIAVSKGQPREAIDAAIEAGHRLFGENRVQEAKAKWATPKDRPEGVELHLIGPLQTNKAREAVELFDAIHSLDRLSLAETLVKDIARVGRAPKLFIQVNTGEEPQKAGIGPHAALAFARQCRELGLAVAGLMCIPPEDEEPSLHFALLLKLARAGNLRELSMGMSADFEIAVAFGATHVRVGTAIFGPRPAGATG